MAEPIARTETDSPVPEEESTLVARAKRGDLSAYDDLVKRYQERIYATIYHMTSNHEDANDLAQARAALKILPENAGSAGLHGLTDFLAQQIETLAVCV